jgi:signal transduction histidine kinase
VLAVPLLWEGKALGVLVLVGGRHWDDADGGQAAAVAGADQEELARAFAAHAAVAIRNAQIYEEAKRLDRLQSAFVAAVSHELRTPLTGMKAPLEILATKYGQSLNAAGQELLHICRESAERLEDLVELILFSAESEDELHPRQLEEITAGELVNEAVQLVAGVASHKGVKIVTRAAGSTVMLHASRRGMVRVLTNLLSNAVKFSEGGESVRIEVESDGSRVQFHVIDRGAGIDEADQPLIFRRFAQLDGSLTRRTGGTGLGLSVSKALVEKHGGQIHVASQPGRGSRFTVDLPIHSRSTAA